MTRKFGAILLTLALILSTLVFATAEGETDVFAASVDQTVMESVEMALSDDEYRENSEEEIIFDEGFPALAEEADDATSPEDATMPEVIITSIESIDDACIETSDNNDVEADISANRQASMI